MQGRWINMIYPLGDKKDENPGAAGILSLMY